jgi:hypothetical protein
VVVHHDGGGVNVETTAHAFGSLAERLNAKYAQPKTQAKQMAPDFVLLSFSLGMNVLVLCIDPVYRSLSASLRSFVSLTAFE